MKRNFIVLGLIAALFTMVSCQKDQNFIRASITPYHGAEKVHLNSANYACWDGNESVWINENEYQITAISGDNEHFLIDMGSNKPAHEGDKLYAVYHPSTVTLGTYSSTNHTIGITLPATQTYSEDGNGNQVIDAPMVAYDEINPRGGADLVFSNVCALLKVQLQPNVICYYIEVTSSNAPLNGTGTINITSKTLTMPTTGTTETKTVRLTVNEESNLANPNCRADGVYYIVLPPYMGSNLTVTVYDNPQTYMTFSQNAQNGHALGAGEIGIIDVNTLDAGRGLFSVDTNGTLVSFAPGNLTGNGTYTFTSSQETVGTVYDYDVNDINTYSGAMGDEWLLLTAEQWVYLLGRTDPRTRQVLHGRCSVNDQPGLYLLPDNWSAMNCPVNVTDSRQWASIDDNWETLRNYGVVFLPSHQSNNNSNKYWTSTSNTVVVFGNGQGLPNGGSGVVGSSVNNGITGVQQSNGLGDLDGCIRLAHIVEDHRTQPVE